VQTSGGPITSKNGIALFYHGLAVLSLFAPLASFSAVTVAEENSERKRVADGRSKPRSVCCNNPKKRFFYFLVSCTNNALLVSH